MVEDRWNQFRQDMNEDRQQAFGTAIGMISGIVATAAINVGSGF